MRRLLFVALWVLLCATASFAQNTTALAPQALPGLNVQIRGGTILLANSSIGISNTTVALSNNTTNYVFLSSAGVVQTNTTGFTSTVLPIATVLTAQGQIVDIQDNRPDYIFAGGGSGLPAGLTAPNGVGCIIGETPSGGVAGTYACNLSGVPTNAQTGVSYTIAATDRNGYVTTSNAGAIAVTLPQAGSGGGTNNDFTHNFAYRECNIGVGTATITPTTSTIDVTTGSSFTAPAASMALTTGQCAVITSDNTNYHANLLGGGTPGCSTSCSWYPLWLSPPTALTNQSMSTTANQPLLVRFNKVSQDTATRIAYYVGTLSAASTGDIGLFGNCTTTCSLLWHTGSFSTAATGAASVVITPVVTGPGTYYLATCNSGTVAQLQAGSLGGFQPTIMTQGVANIFGSDGNAGDACTAGVLPNAITIANITNAGFHIPFIAVSN